MDEDLERRLKTLATRIDDANSLGYRPRRETLVAMDNAVGGEDLECVFVSLKKSDEGRGVSGMLLLVGATLVTRVLLDRVTIPRLKLPDEGRVSLTTVRRSRLRHFDVSVPAHETRVDWSEPSGFTDDSMIELDYDGLGVKMVFRLGQFGTYERDSVVRAFARDLSQSS